MNRPGKARAAVALLALLAPIWAGAAGCGKYGPPVRAGRESREKQAPPEEKVQNQAPSRPAAPAPGPAPAKDEEPRP